MSVVQEPEVKWAPEQMVEVILSEPDDFLLNTLRTKKRFSPWLRKDTIKDLDLVKRYYGYSNEKAKQALRILTKDQLNFIKSKFETGGKR